VVAAHQEEKVGALSLRDRWLAGLLSWAGWVVIQFIGRTSRLNPHLSPAVKELMDTGRPFIYAFWHRYQILMAWEQRHRGIHVLVSRSRDGELIARVLHRLGYRTARGSSSRGGASAFRQLVEAVQGGKRAAFTPDGPRGPLRSVQPGVLALAARTGVPIVPIAWAGTRVKQLSNWDQFLIPKPFGRYALVFGEPLHVAEENDAARDRLRDALNRVEEEAAAQLAKC